VKSAEKIAGMFLAAGLLSTACAPASPDIAPVTVDVSTLPDKLPPAVSAVASAVVKVYFDGYADTGRYSSGVRLTPDTVVTTGHLFDRPTHCNSIVVDASTKKTRTSSGSVRGIRTWTGTVRKRFDTTDAAIITLPKAAVGSMDIIPSLPIRDVTAEPLQSGESVYTFGFGQYPFVNGESHQRDLYGTSFTPEQLRKGYANPHIIGSVALQTMGTGSLAGRRYIVATGLKDYTQGEKDPEKRLHSGDSGSVSVDKSGRLIGVTAQSNWEISLEGIQKEYKAELTHLPIGYDPSLGVIQPIDLGVVADLQSRPVESCTPR